MKTIYTLTTLATHRDGMQREHIHTVTLNQHGPDANMNDRKYILLLAKGCDHKGGFGVAVRLKAIKITIV